MAANSSGGPAVKLKSHATEIEELTQLVRKLLERVEALEAKEKHSGR